MLIDQLIQLAVAKTSPRSPTGSAALVQLIAFIVRHKAPHEQVASVRENAYAELFPKRAIPDIVVQLPLWGLGFNPF